MPIEMPKGLPFSVDTFTASSKRKRHHFLTHAHKDHSSGISTHFAHPIYATHLTKSLILQQFPQLDGSLFVCIEVGQSLVLEDPDGDFTVTAFDANHCSGAVMFLFEGNFGKILHTGDCRLTPECLLKLPEKYIGRKGKEPRCRLDYIFLDCTFGRFLQKLPSKNTAIQQIINCIWKHPGANVVYLTCDLLGQEEILENVTRTFGSKIYVDKIANPDSFQTLMFLVPEILTDDPLSRFHLLDGFPKLYERAKSMLAEAQLNFQPEPLVIRASAQWYACDEEHSEIGSQTKLRFNEAVKDKFGVWHVCYSMHSSREELEWGLQLLAPKRVVSTTPGCWAMELDYVKKHCFSYKIPLDDPLWKLLDINVEASPQKNAEGIYPMVVKPTQTTTESQQQPEKLFSFQKDLFGLSPPSIRPPVTLFGRARHGLHDSDFPHERPNFFTEDEYRHIDVNEAEKESGIQEDTEASLEDVLEIQPAAVVAVAQHENLTTKETCMSSRSPIGHVKCYSNSSASCDAHKQFVVHDIEEVYRIQEESEDVEVNKENVFNEKVEIDVHVMQHDESISSSRTSSHFPSIYPKGYSDSFRKFYRSMNVPVPKPLPSLVKLKNANVSKRARRRVEF